MCVCDDAVVAEQEIAGGGASVWLLRELIVMVVAVWLCVCICVGIVCVRVSACRMKKILLASDFLLASDHLLFLWQVFFRVVWRRKRKWASA